jgi:HK97 family phage major capsid protein
MLTELTEQQALAARKHSAPLLRTLGVRNAIDYEPHKLDWRSLGEHKNAIAKAAGELIDKLEGKSDEELRSLNDAHDAHMALLDAINEEKDWRSELGDRGPRAEGGNPKRPRLPDGAVNGVDGYSVERATTPEAFALRSNQRMVDYVVQRNQGAEYAGLSEGAYLRAMVLGPKTDLERRALAEGTDSAGGYSVPDRLSAMMIDRLRPASVVFRAGAQLVPLTSDTNYVAKVVTDPSPAWRNENASAAESDPTFGRVTLTPRSLMVIVRVSRELLEDSLNMETVLPQVIASAMASEVDRVALLGTGSAPEPRGIVNFSGLTSNSFAGGQITNYSPLIMARTALRTANSDVTAYIMHPRDEGRFAELLDGNGQSSLVPPAIRDVPMLVTSKLPTNGGVGTNESQIFAGDWSRLMIGVRSQLQIEVLRERYADVHQYGFVAHLRADVAAEHEAAFTVLGGITP